LHALVKNDLMDSQYTCPNCDAPAQEGDAYCGQCGARLRSESAPAWNWPAPPANGVVKSNGNGNGPHPALDVTETEEIIVAEAPATDTAVEPEAGDAPEPDPARWATDDDDESFVPLGIPVQLDPPQPGGLRRLLPLGKFRQG
jgi:hypothetical protein